MKKLSLEYSTHILVLFWSLPDFTCIAFKVFLCGMFVHVATHHTASRSLEIFHASPNQCLFMRKISLSQSWFTHEMFLWFTCGSNILPLCFICLNFWKLAKYSKISWNFSKVFGSVFVDEKTWFGVLNTHISAFLESPRFHLYSFQGLPLCYVCSCGNSPYCIEITWNFPRISESMPFHEKTKFEPVVIYWRHVPIVHLWL